MTCLNKNKQGEEILLAYCAGTLDTERTGAVENHARECGECRTLIAAQMDVWRALEEWAPPEVSADFDARLYARIAQQEAEPQSWARMRAWLRELFSPGLSSPVLSWKPVLAGAVAAAVLAVGLMVHLPPHITKSQDSSQQIRTESVDVEQVEVTLQDLEMLMPPSASTGKM